jgi:hypothetical protein
MTNELSAGDKSFTAWGHYGVVAAGRLCQMDSRESRWKSPVARTPRECFAGHLSIGCSILSRALSRPFVPPTPRLAIDSYWSAHPIRADRLARALAALSGAPSGWSWRLGNGRNGLPASFRTPPCALREPAYGKFCCVCGQPVYRFGWHLDLWDSGPNKKAV